MVEATKQLTVSDEGWPTVLSWFYVVIFTGPGCAAATAVLAAIVPQPDQTFLNLTEVAVAGRIPGDVSVGVHFVFGDASAVGPHSFDDHGWDQGASGSTGPVDL